MVLVSVGQYVDNTALLKERVVGSPGPLSPAPRRLHCMLFLRLRQRRCLPHRLQPGDALSAAHLHLGRRTPRAPPSHSQSLRALCLSLPPHHCRNPFSPGHVPRLGRWPSGQHLPSRGHGQRRAPIRLHIVLNSLALSVPQTRVAASGCTVQETLARHTRSLSGWRPPSLWSGTASRSYHSCRGR